MPESSAEMFDRVRLMARIDTDWDLSDKDTAALRHVLAAAEASEAPATEVIPGGRAGLDALTIRPDSLSETVEKLREACKGVRVEPEPEEPSAAEAEHLLTIAKAALRRYAEGCWLPAKSDNSFSDRRGNPRMRLAAFEDQGGEIARLALEEIEILEAIK